MVDQNLKHNNQLLSGSRYAADFDYLMHEFCIKKFTPLLTGRYVLEMGCYHGHMTRLLASICPSVCALDIDEECIRISKKNLSDIASVSFYKASFDNFKMPKGVEVIYFSHALEHTPDPLATLRYIKSQITDQKLIVVVPNADSLSRKIAEKMGIIPNRLCVTDFERKIGHHITFNREMLEGLAERADFSIRESGGIFPKIFSNGQIDASMSAGIIDRNFLAALNELSIEYPEICASVYVVLE